MQTRKSLEKIKEEVFLLEIDEDTTATTKREEWHPEWIGEKRMRLCPHDWCTYNMIGGSGNMQRHVQKCKEQYEKGMRLKHLPGQFNAHPGGHYVSIEEAGLALDLSICKQEPIDEEDQPHVMALVEQSSSSSEESSPKEVTAVEAVEEVSRKRKLDDEWQPDWTGGQSVRLCPHDWCTFNVIGKNGRSANMWRHIKRCKEKYEAGYRLRHVPGQFNAHPHGGNKNYVSIAEEGLALDATICKQEPITDEYDQQPEHYMEAPQIEDLPVPSNPPKKRKLIDISDNSSGSQSQTGSNSTLILCPHSWCTFNQFGNQLDMVRHARECNEKYNAGLRMNHFPGRFNAHSGKYVSIEEYGLGLDKSICKVEPEPEPEAIITKDQATQSIKITTQDQAVQATPAGQSKSELYGELFDVETRKIDVMLKIYGTYDAIFAKLEHRLTLTDRAGLN